MNAAIVNNDQNMHIASVFYYIYFSKKKWILLFCKDALNSSEVTAFEHFYKILDFQ